jgi:predicted MPP superfamily phosphohydrolase
VSFFIIVVVVLSLMYGYVGWRLIVPAAFSLPVNILLWASVVVLLVLPFLPIVTRMRTMHGAWIDLVSWVAYLSFGIVTVLFAFLFARDVLWMLVLAYHKVAHLLGSSGAADALADPERRRLLINTTNLGLLGVTGALAGYGLYEAMRTPRIVRVDLPVANLPAGLDGYTIAQISDLHVSHVIKRSFVQGVVDEVNKLKPDMIALTGDLVDGSVEQWIEETRRLGFDVLLNEHRLIEKNGAKLLLGGVTDYSDRHSQHPTDPHKAISDAPACDLKILLAHQPLSIYEAEKAGFDYIISGHTHGGQYFPYHVLVGLFQPYVAGLHQHGRSRIYVSRGTGFWGPQIRIGAPSEITLHRLVRA